MINDYNDPIAILKYFYVFFFVILNGTGKNIFALIAVTVPYYIYIYMYLKL